jgi:hypothetical protein
LRSYLPSNLPYYSRIGNKTDHAIKRRPAFDIADLLKIVLLEEIRR